MAAPVNLIAKVGVTLHLAVGDQEPMVIGRGEIPLTARTDMLPAPMTGTAELIITAPDWRHEVAEMLRAAAQAFDGGVA